MKKTLAILAVAALAGCTTQSYTRTAQDGSRVTYRAVAWFNNASVKGLNIDSATKETKTGLKVSSQENETATEALKATVQAAVEGAVKGAIGKP